MKVILINPVAEVTQTDMQNLLTLDGQIEHLQGLRDRIAASVLSRITAGAPVEDGFLHYHVETSYHGKVQRRKLVVRAG